MSAATNKPQFPVEQETLGSLGLLVVHIVIHVEYLREADMVIELHGHAIIHPHLTLDMETQALWQLQCQWWLILVYAVLCRVKLSHFHSSREFIILWLVRKAVASNTFH